MKNCYVAFLIIAVATLISCKESANRSESGDDSTAGNVIEALGSLEEGSEVAGNIRDVIRLAEGIEDGDINPLIQVMGDKQMQGLSKVDLLYNGSFRVGDVGSLQASSGASGMEQYSQLLTKKYEESYDSRGFSNVKSNLSDKVPGEALNVSGLYVGLSLRDAIKLLKGKGYRWRDSSGDFKKDFAMAIIDTNASTNYINFEDWVPEFFDDLYRLMYGPADGDDEYWFRQELDAAGVREGDDVYRFRFVNDRDSDDLPSFRDHCLNVSFNPKHLFDIEELKGFLTLNLIFKFGYLVALDISYEREDETHQMIANAWLKRLNEIKERDFNFLDLKGGRIAMYDGKYLVSLEGLANTIIADKELEGKRSLLRKIDPDAALESPPSPSVANNVLKKGTPSRIELPKNTPSVATNGVEEEAADKGESPATPSLANNHVKGDTSGKGKSLQLAKNALVGVSGKIEKERERWKSALAVINKLTNFKKTPVREGSPQYYKCVEASKIIREVEAKAPKLKAEKTRLEKLIQSLEEE